MHDASYARDIIIGIVLLGVLIQRQLTPRPLSGRLLLLPGILGVYAIYAAAGNAQVGLAGWISLLVTLVLSLVVGLIRGRLTHVYQENGRWMVAGSWKTLVFWLASIPIRYGVHFLLVPLLGPGAAFQGSTSTLPYLFSIAGLMLGRAAMLALRHPEAVRQASLDRKRDRAARRGR
ncbi:hypothetical protein JI721_06010 [Alicyclobacillus cycloheptanicus]|uniref:DUF1453 domain-containing protein n=1 Tax=Alicyclobacillus cycloheptanicus TaxID=1457 RepID=A0ABT9XM40_9BACL|nr:hypothetical protein [Alicyclobacillus cycloheptanicus]MDQ0191380.1 hypothetical protein [Alicyclobacillus cycloheptanicus]WDM02355.1 hypothetical protein JI721_06010 [Alicyclobacillus cycloheptanicus]